eukprot:INCI2223.1.p1 GENE.INCI2223.1~~INCI2223.1.p1  ORF type:complete len:150 (-),score=34.36 INCI2223.1:265-714(-)
MIRGVWQLQKLTIRYCPHNGSSAGARKFLREQAAEFARQNPQLELHAAVGAGKHPVAIGSYLYGDDKVIDMKNAEPDHILSVCTELRNTTGRKITKIKKEIYGKVDSIQGKWEPNIRYPDMKLTHEVADAGVAGTSAEQADSQQESVTA